MQKSVVFDLGTLFCTRVLDEIFLLWDKSMFTLLRVILNLTLRRNEIVKAQNESFPNETFVSSHKDWTDILPFATFAHNTAVHDT